MLKEDIGKLMFCVSVFNCDEKKILHTNTIRAKNPTNCQANMKLVVAIINKESIIIRVKIKLAILLTEKNSIKIRANKQENPAHKPRLCQEPNRLPIFPDKTPKDKISGKKTLPS